MDRTTRPLVIIAAFAGSLVIGLVIMQFRVSPTSLGQ